MFSNLPTMLQQQDFQTRHADMLAAAREGMTVDKTAQPNPYAGISLRRITEYRPGGDRIVVEASNQQGYSLIVYPLPETLDVGTILNIENVTRWRRMWDDNVLCDFILTKRAEKGDRVLHLYPPIDAPKTVNHLPMHGAVVTVKEPPTFLENIVLTADCSVGEPVQNRRKCDEPDGRRWLCGDWSSPSEPKNGGMLRIRVPKDYVMTDGPGLPSPSWAKG